MGAPHLKENNLTQRNKPPIYTSIVWLSVRQVSDKLASTHRLSTGFRTHKSMDCLLDLAL